MSDTVRPHLTSHNLTGQIADKLRALYAGMSKWENSIFDAPRLNPDDPNLGAGDPTIQTGDQWGLGLIHIWSVSDLKQPILRIIIFLLFRAGIVLLAIPAVYTFVQVILILAKHLFT